MLIVGIVFGVLIVGAIVLGLCIAGAMIADVTAGVVGPLWRKRRHIR